MMPPRMQPDLYAHLGHLFPDPEDLAEVAAKLDDQRFRSAESLAHESTDDLVAVGLPRAFARTLANAFGPKATAPAPAAPIAVTVTTAQTPATMPRRALLDLFVAGDRSAEVLDAMRERAPRVLVPKAAPALVDAAETEAWLSSPASRNAAAGDTVRGHFRVKTVDDLVSPTIELDPVDLTELDAGFNGATDWRAYPREVRAFVYFVFHDLPTSQRPATSTAAVLDALDAANNDLARLPGRAWKQAVEAWRDAKADDPALEGQVLATIYPTRAARTRSVAPESVLGGPFAGSAAAPVGGALDLRAGLRGADLGAFHKALMSAFPGHDALAQMVYFGLGERLDGFVRSGSLSWEVFDLLTWAGSRDHYGDLLAAARKANPGNPDLRAFAARCAAPAAPAWDAAARKRLRDALSALFDPSRMRVLAVDAEINPDRVTLSGSPTDVALSLVEEAGKAHKIDALLSVAKREYPSAMAQRGF